VRTTDASPSGLGFDAASHRERLESHRGLGEPCGSDEDALLGEVAAVVARIRVGGLLSELTLEYRQNDLRAFAIYMAKVHQLAHLREVTPVQARQYLTLPRVTASGVGDRPATSLHGRRSTVRLLFRVARQLGLADSDPTLDIELPRRPVRTIRALVDEEVALGRSYSLTTLTESRVPASWALGEATAGPSEQAHICVSDIDTKLWRVWIHGGDRHRSRWGQLTEWGSIQVERQLRSVPRQQSDDPLLLIRRGRSSAANRLRVGSDAISSVLRRSGLSSDPGVHAGSLPAWAGAKALADGAPIDEVARMLGVTKLDRAAAIVGLQWRSAEGT
jgi:site-specific recombinase XerD